MAGVGLIRVALGGLDVALELGAGVRLAVDVGACVAVAGGFVAVG
jgi:hypothetical protein